jgi:hypothetical protein
MKTETKMLIQSTGAEIVKVAGMYNVVYDNQVIYSSEKRDISVAFALESENIVVQSKKSNVFYLMKAA